MFLTRLIKFILVHSWVTWNAYPVLSIKEHDAYGLKPSTHGIKKPYLQNGIMVLID